MFRLLTYPLVDREEGLVGFLRSFKEVVPAATEAIQPASGEELGSYLLPTGYELSTLAVQPSLNLHRDPLQMLSRTQRTLPHDADAPAGPKKLSPVLPVAADIGLELPLPVRAVGRRRRCALTPFVTVPEAAVYEANRPEPREDEVRPARKRRIVELVPEAAGVERATQDQLGPGVPALNSRHDARSSRAVEGIRHTLLGPGRAAGDSGGERRLAHRC